jgi:hypothetical protein
MFGVNDSDTKNAKATQLPSLRIAFINHPHFPKSAKGDVAISLTRIQKSHTLNVE